MDDHNITELISNKFSTLNKISQKLQKTFNYEHLKAFTTEVKKLKALMHLIQHDNKTGEIYLPNAIKTLYGYVAILQNYQSNRKEIDNSSTVLEETNNEFYLDNFKKAETYWRTKALELMKSDAVITCQNKFLKNMEGKISKITINSFLQNSRNKLRNSKKINDEVSLRVIHKLLEDLYYNWEYIKKNPINPFPSQTILEQLLIQLQNFENICIRLEFLDPKYFNRMKNNKEKEKLIKVRNKLLQKKHDMIQQLGTLFTNMFNIL